VTDSSISSSGSDRLAVTVSATSMNKFVLSLTSPQVNGTAFTGANTLTAEDAYGNTVTSFSASANNVTIGANSPLTGAVSGLSGGNQLTGAGDFVSGVANLASLLTYTGNAASGTFTASSATGSYTGSSGSVTISAGTVSKLVVTLPGQTFTSGVGNSGTVTAQTAGTAFIIVSITATDANFNTVTSYSGDKTISYTGPGGTPTYTTAVSFTSGQSTTTLATTLTTAETTTITASDGTTTGPASSSLTVYATGTWLGTTSTDWFTAANWWGGVPTSSTDALIPASAPYQPVIDASGAVCRNLTINPGASLTVSDSYSFSVSGNWANGGSFTAGTGTVVFNGGSAQIIGGAATTTFNNLTINNTSGVTASSDTTVNGVLTLQSANPSATQGSLDMWDGSVMKTLTMGGSAMTIGAGDVTGIVTRTSFVAANSYTFGNQYSTINFQNIGTLPTSVSIKITIGTAPSWKTDAIQRTCDLIQSGASGSYATINTHYLDTELNGNTENNLVWWVDNPAADPGQVVEFGRSNYEMANNWVGISSIPVSLFPSSFGQTLETLGTSALATATWNGSVSTEWIDPLNWTPNGVPSDLANVVIPDASTTPYDPTLPVGALAVGTLTLQSGAILNATATSTMTISGGSGAWSDNGGTFNHSTSTVIFTSALATISGDSDFYNVTIASGAGLTLGSSGAMRIGGTMINNGTWRAAQSANNIVEYNGGDQTVLSPNGLTPGYDILILSSSGIKTLASTTTVSGNVEIDSGVKFNLTG